MSKIDLHIHSSFSDDAEFHPEIILKMAKDADMKIIAIADHNTSEAYRHFDYQNTAGITVIAAIELDCVIDGVNLHVLGLGIDPLDEAFRKIYDEIMIQEKTAGIKRVELVNKLGIHVDLEEVLKKSEGKTITGEKIAETALNDERNKECSLLEVYRKGGTRSDNPLINFYWDFCAPGKEAYAEVDFISLKEAVDTIHQSGGIAVLAHPGNNIHEDEALLEKIMNCKVDGIEVYSSYHNEKQIEFYHKKALEYQCLITCGSDFHGRTKPTIKLGCPVTKESDEQLEMMLMRALSGHTR